ncbi:hypothetical protein BG452_15685 [Streptomyces sp. CBMA123]|nr:hypothetical protein [Streptomyces sp. CBMA123]
MSCSVESGLGGESGAAGRGGGVQLAAGVEQGGHLVAVGQRAPAQVWRLADQGEVDAERDLRVAAQEPERVRGGVTGRHQAAGRGDVLLDRLDDGEVDGLVQAEVVAGEEQEAGVGWVAEEPVGVRAVRGGGRGGHGGQSSPGGGAGARG